jgi:hypothetical protein
VPLGRPCPREELGQDQCAYCHQDGYWKDECPQWARDSRRPPRPEAEAKLLRENIGFPAGKLAPGRKIFLDWQPQKALKRNRTDWAPFYWAPRSLWSK